MAEKVGADLRDILADAMGDLYDGGTLKIYSGSQPATPDTAPSGTLLASITLPTPAFGAASSGVKAKAGTWTTSAVAGAPTNAGWFRIADAGDDNPADGAVGATGSGAELELDNISILSGQTVTISSFTLTQPAS